MTTPAVIPYRAIAVSLSLAWQTDVLKRWDGSEQRLARLTSPRETYGVTFDLLDADVAAIRELLMFAPVDGFYLPVRVDQLPVTAAVTGTAVHAVADEVDWPTVGLPVMVENQTGDYYTSTISALSGYPGAATFTLADSPPIGKTFAAALTHIIPLALVDIADASPLQRAKVNVGGWQVSARARDFHSVWGTGASVSSFDGLPVLDRAPSAPGRVEEQVDAGIEVLDNGTIAEVETARTNSDIVRFHQFTIGAGATSFASERQWWRAFLYAVRGRQKPFLLPTWRADVLLHTTPTPGSTTMIVEATPSYLAWFASSAHKHLQLTTNRRAGAWTYVTVASVVDNHDGTHTITLGGGTVVPADPLESISFLEVCRLEQDEVPLTFTTGGGTVELHARVIQYAADSAPSTYDQYEKSTSSAAPIELWKIETTQTTYYLTTRETSYTFALDGQTYTPVPGARSELVGGSISDPADLVLDIPAADSSSGAAWHAVVRDNAFGIPSQKTRLTIYRILGTAPLEIHQGTITSWSVKGRRAQARSVNLLSDALGGASPAARVQRPCNRVLYDTTRTRCMVDRAAFKLDPTIGVASVSGTTIVLTSIGGHPAQWLRGGEIIRNSDGERRLIKDQIGVTLHIDEQFVTLSTSDAISLYPGCDHGLETVNGCRIKFGNAVNFGGHAYLPPANPHVGEVRGKVWT